MPQSLAEARKGIRTREGLEMAKKNFQMDQKQADTDKDGKLSDYEKVKGEAVQRAMAKDELPEMSHGGMPCGSDYEDGLMVDPMMLGTTSSEKADNIPVMISENEYVLPAHVVKWHGLKHIMDMQTEAEMGLMAMHDMGLLFEVDRETKESDSESVEDAEVSDEGDTEQKEEETIETPEGNEIEVAGIETILGDPRDDETDEYKENSYGSYGMMKTPGFTFIM